jgi:caffeoyl-CoA O-methyltransferase
MFHDIPEAVVERMAQLEAIDARDRLDGTERLERLRQVPRDVVGNLSERPRRQRR